MHFLRHNIASTVYHCTSHLKSMAPVDHTNLALATTSLPFANRHTSTPRANITPYLRVHQRGHTELLHTYRKSGQKRVSAQLLTDCSCTTSTSLGAGGLPPGMGMVVRAVPLSALLPLPSRAGRLHHTARAPSWYIVRGICTVIPRHALTQPRVLPLAQLAVSKG